MNNKKDIDSIYRERFKNAKVKPPEDAWDNILARLPEQESKKRILPWWYLAAGTAAAVVLFFALSVETLMVEGKPRVVSDEAPIENSFQAIDSAFGVFDQQMTAAGKVLMNLRKNDLQEIISSEVTKEQIAEVSKKTFSTDVSFAENVEVQENNSSSKELTAETALTEEKAVEEVPNPLEQLKNEENALAKVKDPKPENRFSVTTKVAPVYFDNFGKGNPLDDKFSQNSSGGEISISYGINMAYQLSEKVKIRSGVSKVDLAYSTSSVSFNDYKSTATAKTKVREGAGIMLASPIKGELSQTLGFIEIPLEIEYALVDRKIGINLIGGGSALFLNRNDLVLDSQNFSDHLGQAENLNKFSLSTNIGVGLDYDFTKNFVFSVEPVLKLQLNTFKNVDGLNPYYFGIYSGITYKF